MNKPKTGKVIVPKTRVAGSGAVEAVALLERILEAAQEYAEVREVEATKQAAIRARMEVDLAEIHAKRELFITYLNRSFDERAENFKNLFSSLDRAMQTGGEVASILGAITTLAASSPFRDLQDVEMVRRNLDDPDHEWTV